MPSCIVKGCTHYTGMKASNPLLTMHVFPRELSRIKLWLRQIGQNFGDLDSFASKVHDASRTGKYRICSAHFAPGSYTSQGSRIVLKHDAIPTLFPGIYPRPPPDWKPQPAQDTKPQPAQDTKPQPAQDTKPQPAQDTKPQPAQDKKPQPTQDKKPQPAQDKKPQPAQDKKPQPAQDKKPDPTGKGDNMDAAAPKAAAQKKEAGPQNNADCHKRLQEGARRGQGAKQGRTPGPPRAKLLDVNGRFVGRKDTKFRPDELRSLPLPPDTADQNRRALWSLENVMVSLLQHLADAPLKSRAQKQKTSRLLTQTAEVVSVLTGEEWTVVKKNSHISKFYNMIREVPIKCGDVAVFFSMDEWDYIEDHEEHYKHVMVEEPKSLQFNGSSDGVKSDFLPDTQCEQRPNFNDIDFGDILQSSVTVEPLTVKEQARRENIEVLEMSCSSDDDMEEPACDPPPSARIESSSEDKDVRGPLDVPRSPASPPAPTDEHKGKKDEEVLETSRPTDEDSAEAKPETPEQKDPPSAADAVAESAESSSSELWIAQDGTTSHTWIPQDDPRPKGRNCFKYGKHAGRIQCPVSLSGVTICVPEQPLKRTEATPDLHCDLCDLSFPDKYELELHQLTHSKKQRL